MFFSYFTLYIGQSSIRIIQAFHIHTHALEHLKLLIFSDR